MMSDFKFTPSEIGALRIIADRGEISLQELSSLLEMSHPYASQVGSSLVSKGILESERKGRAIRFRFAGANHASAIRNLIIEHEHMNLERILSYSNLDILSSIVGRELSLGEIVKETGLSKRTVTASLADLKAFGVVAATKGYRYRIGDRFGTLRHMLVETMKYLNEMTVRDMAPDAVIIWQWKNEFLFRTRSDIKRRHCFLTGLSKAPDFGIRLFMPETNYYFITPFKRRMRVEDAILHALLVDRTDTRVLMTVLLLWKKNEKRLDMKYLTTKAQEYGLKTLVKDIELYLRDGVTEWKYLPGLAEFRQKAGEYGL